MVHPAQLPLPLCHCGCRLPACLPLGLTTQESGAQDTERGRHASLSTLLEEVRERGGARVPREELERARAEASARAALAVPALDASAWLLRGRLAGVEVFGCPGRCLGGRGNEGCSLYSGYAAEVFFGLLGLHHCCSTEDLPVRAFLEAQTSVLRDENMRLKERLRVMEEELSRLHRVL